MTNLNPLPCELDALGDEALCGWLRPLGRLAGSAGLRARATGRGLALAGSDITFTAVEILARRSDRVVVAATAPLALLRRWAASRGSAMHDRMEACLEAIAAARAPWAGLAFDHPRIMGILNVTPDSFSDGGAFLTPASAIAHGRAMAEAGADIIDVGGESTRPGAPPVAPEDEIGRIEPVIRALTGAGAAVSVDTRHAAVMAVALAAGARIVNDVSALAGDPASLDLVACAGAPAVLMHMRGEPQTMQHDPYYALASLDVVEELAARIAACEAAGIPRARLVVDPGIGFGKSLQHNLEILARIGLFHGLGCGVLVGLSRKSLVGRLTGAAAGERLPGSLAGALHVLAEGVQIVRVHDVAETRQAVALWQAIAAAG